MVYIKMLDIKMVDIHENYNTQTDTVAFLGFFNGGGGIKKIKLNCFWTHKKVYCDCAPK